MRESEQQTTERSMSNMPGPRGIELSVDGWEQDAQLLKRLAYLSDTRPVDLLRKAAWSVGESADLEFFHKGRPLSAATRGRLSDLLNDQMRVELETIDHCGRASSQLTRLIAIVIGLTGLALLLLI